MHINVRSLNANFEELEILLGKLKSKPSIIICSETWYLPCPQYFNLQGYHMIYNESYLNKADGSVIFIKTDFDYQMENVEIDKVKFLSVLIKFNKFNLKITSTYRCQVISKKKYVKAMHKLLLKNKGNKNHLIVGDFNINLLSNEIDSEDFINNFFDYEYIPFFNQITRPNPHNDSGTCIDNIFVKSTNINSFKSHKLLEQFGDQYPLFLSVDFNLTKSPNTNNINYIDYKKMKTLLPVSIGTQF